MDSRETQRITSSTVAAMDTYFFDKESMGLVFPWTPSVEGTGIPYIRSYNGVGWEATSVFQTSRWSAPTYCGCAHAGTFTQILMPELHRIAVDSHGCILVEPYRSRLLLSLYVRLEVDETKERLGVWEFKAQHRPQPSVLLHLKFTVLSVGDFAPGAWVEQ